MYGNLIQVIQVSSLRKRIASGHLYEKYNLRISVKLRLMYSTINAIERKCGVFCIFNI